MITRITVNVPADLRRRANAVAALRGETVSDVVRSALEQYVAESVQRAGGERELREDDALFALIGIAEGGPADLSSRKHDYAVE